MRKFFLAFFLAWMLGSLGLAVASITIVGDSQIAFGSATTSQALTLPTTPAVGQVEYVSVQLALTPAPTVQITSPAGAAFVSQACSGITSNAQYLLTHNVVSGDTSSVGTISFSSSSAGAIHVSLRGNVNGTTPVAGCFATTAPAAATTPSITGVATYKNTLPEFHMQTADLPAVICTTGAATCNASGWTESGFTTLLSFGEAQYNNTQGGKSVTGSMNLTNAGTAKKRLMLWFDAPTTLLTFCNVGGLVMMGVGC